MKKLIGLAGLLMLIAAGCEQYSIDVTETQSADAASGIRVYASIEQPVSADTKVYADANLRVLWNANDTISFFNQMTLNEMWGFTGVDGANSGYFDRLTTQVGTGNDLDFYCAVYPYDGSVAISNEGVMTLTLPAVQKYAANSFGRGANTMIGVSANPTFSFKNVGGFLSFKLYGDGVNVSSITLKGNNNELIAGEGTIPIALDSLPKITMSGTATKEITLVCNPPVAIGSSASAYTEFFMVVPPTTFSAGFSVTITDDQGRRVSKVLNSSLEIKRSSIRRMAPLEVVLADPEAVDLGLPSGLKWATFNVGAAQPEETGYFLAWGETAPKGNYSLGVYSLWTGSGHQFTKYTTTSSSYVSAPDNKLILETEDDAASVTWGGEWQIPNADEWAELKENCTWTWTTVDGKDGYNVASTTNSNSIFLPVTGYRYNGDFVSTGNGFYWSSSLIPTRAHQALCTNISSGNVLVTNMAQRERGLAVRPVSNTQHVTSVALDKTELTLAVLEDADLTATLTPSLVHVPTLTWTSSNPSVVMLFDRYIYGEGKIRGLAPGTATITVTTVDGGYTASCTVTVVEPEAVDLGLPSGRKWASFNVGAHAPEEYGGHFAWAETAVKDNYDWPTYAFAQGSGTNVLFTKYVATDAYGTVDNILTLESDDDVAAQSWSGGWRIPTDAMWTELRNNCTWTWTTLNGVDGYRVASTRNSNSIFLPAAGMVEGVSLNFSSSVGYYWSASLEQSNSARARAITFSSSGINMAGRYRSKGLSVRAVK